MTSVGEKLSEAAASLESATRSAVEWVGDPANLETIRRNRPTLDERDLRRRTVELQRLREAATRPMAVAVFGASQHGKSYMVSVLAGIGSNLHIDLPGFAEPVDYIGRINPAGGKESTGLVTRFTIRPSDAPADHPVQLRLLSHADILKILLNGYLHEGDPQVYERDPKTQEVGPSAEQIARHIADFSVGGSTTTNGLSVDDIWDLAEYVTVDLAKLGFVGRLAPFWDAAAKIAPRLDLDQAGRFFSILWGQHEVLTRTYTRLIGALRDLGYARTAHCSFDAIDVTAGGTSILDVAALLGITDDQSAPVSVRAPGGPRAMIARPILCAIAAELHLTISKRPWKFFDGIDVLDFPGYRPRGLPEEGRDDKNQPIGGLKHYFSKNVREYMKELFLRGKVEYLFQRYVAEQEVSAMLLCVKGVLDVPTLPTVISQWIESAEGAEPRDRAGKPNLLLFVLTMFDMHLGESKADPGQGLAVRFNNRMEASLLEKFGRHDQSWVKQWTPGEPFRNCFLMRNPGIQNPGLFAYRDGDEVEILAGQTDWIARLKAAFLSVEHVQRHFADPARAFDEMLRLNDGGAGYIASYLDAVCDPTIKYRQIGARLANVRNRLLADIEPLHIDEDLQKQRALRLEVAQTILDGIEECAARRRVGSLMRTLMVSTGALSEGLYHAFTMVDGRAGSTETAQGQGLPLPPAAPRPNLNRPGRPAPVAATTGNSAGPAVEVKREPAARNLDVIARVAMNIWRDRLHQAAADPDISEEFGVPRDALRELAVEIYTAAVRSRLEVQLQDAMEKFVFNDKSEERLPKVVLICERLINRFVSHLGFDGADPATRPQVPQTEGARPVFATRPVAYDASGIGATPPPYRDRFVEDWMFAFYQAVDDNATSKEGQRIDVVQNERIGRVVEILHRPLPPEART